MARLILAILMLMLAQIFWAKVHTALIRRDHALDTEFTHTDQASWRFT